MRPVAALNRWEKQMDQKELRLLEAQCVQEEPALCVAACPLHVDAKGFCALVSEGIWNKAWAILARTMPLPGVMARICDGPCKSVCLRKDRGGSIELPALERFCAAAATKFPVVRPLPSRGKKIAILGGGLAALTAAWDLARKGFSVTIFCGRAGGFLLSLPDTVLPAGILESELENLGKLKVEFREAVEMDGGFARSTLDDFDAVFVDSEECPQEKLGLGEPDSVTLGTEQPGIFAGRMPSGQEKSPAFMAAAGRRAANSIERFVQGASLVAGREREGPFETRLFTNVDKVEDASTIVLSAAGYSEEQAKQEAGRCIRCQCLECVKNCVYLEHYGSYPKVYVRQMYNNESIVMGTRHANEMINSCMLCGLCETLCPEDFSMADVCLEARRGMVRSGKMPPSAHEFALRDMSFANGEKAAFARHAPGVEKSSYLFFPGCQLTASDPLAVEAAYVELCQRHGDVGLMLGCCGAPAHWAGRQDMFSGSLERLRGQWEELGKPVLVTACPTCRKVFHEFMPEVDVRSYWSMLREGDLPDFSVRAGAVFAVHDPCAARDDKDLQDGVRALLAGLGVKTVEPGLTRELTECCGFGGLLSEANPPLGAKAAAHRAQAADEDFITYCAMCRDMLAKAGKRALHVFDLLFPHGEDPASRVAPGYSQRRENRARLKEKLLFELWGESGGEPRPFELVRVDFTDQARERMEKRRILVSDVQKTLLHARENGRCLFNYESGRFLAAHRPVVVTYWVDYETDGTGVYMVHNVWCHRMRIVGGSA